MAGDGEAAGECAAATLAPLASEPLDPNAFWGEDSESVHGVIDSAASSVRYGHTRGSRGWWLAAATALALIIIAGLSAQFLGGPQHRTYRPAVAVVQSDAGGAARRLLRTPRTSEHPPRLPTHRPTRGITVPSRPKPTPVIYHAGPAVPASSSSSAVAGSTTPTEHVATAASTPATSPPAFGPAGALGPMSSPDG